MVDPERIGGYDGQDATGVTPQSREEVCLERLGLALRAVVGDLRQLVIDRICEIGQDGVHIGAFLGAKGRSIRAISDGFGPAVLGLRDRRDPPVYDLWLPIRRRPAVAHPLLLGDWAANGV